MNRSTILIFLLALLLLGYSSYRAATLSMTIDESSTWHNFVFKPLHEILSNSPPSGNNHILNTLLIKASVGIFGSNPLTVRLPNVLAHIIYLVFSYLLIRSLSKKPAFLFLGFACLNLNPFMLDFFSLGRGYGISIACMMASLYYLSCFLQQLSQKHLLASMGFAILATYANFTALNYFVSLTAVLLVSIIIQAKEKQIPYREWFQYILNKGAFIFIACMVLGLMVYTPIGKLHASGELRHPGFWGDNGFWEDTVLSLIQHTTFEKRHLDMGKFTDPIFEYLALVVFVCTPIAAFVKLKNESAKPMAQYVLAFWTILMLSGLSTIVQNWIFGTKFLSDRTALIYIPLFALVAFTLFYYVVETYPRLFPWFPILIGAFFMLHLLKSVSFERFRQWQFEEYTEEMVDYISAQAAESDTLVKLGVHWRHMPATNFYIKTRYPNRIAWADWEKNLRQDKKYAYYFVPREDSLLMTKHYEFEKDYKYSLLFRKK